MKFLISQLQGLTAIIYRMRLQISFMIRDANGSVLVASATRFFRFDLALHAELRAMPFGLEMAHSNSLKVCILEGDSCWPSKKSTKVLVLIVFILALLLIFYFTVT